MRTLLLLAIVGLGQASAASEPNGKIDWAALRSQAAAAPTPVGGPKNWSLSGEQRRDQDFSTQWRWPWQSPSLKEYQLGDEWGKKPVSAAMVSVGGAVFARAAKATASYGGATAFYLGKFNGRHIVATNHHVSGSRCKGAAEFPLLARSFACEKVYGDWPEIDLALFSVRVPAQDEPLLAPLARDFAFDVPLRPGQFLLTIGFGSAANPGRVMVANQDSDCRVFSATGDYRLLADPDEINPGTYKAWSFANGCDVSHGDSGSAFVDRETGDVVGLVWTGKFPKSDDAGRSSYLAGLKPTDPAVWTELTLAVPAAKIAEVLRAQSAGSDERAATLAAVLKGR